MEEEERTRRGGRNEIKGGKRRGDWEEVREVEGGRRSRTEVPEKEGGGRRTEKEGGKQEVEGEAGSRGTDKERR